MNARLPGSRLTLALTAAIGSVGAAHEAERPAPALLGDAIESCVDHSAIHFSTGEPRVLLDPADATQVGEALVRRYPVVGLQPQRVALWRKGGAGWIYIALLANPEKPDELCHTATFVADRFDFTSRLLAKYFGSRSRMNPVQEPEMQPRLSAG